MVGQINPEVQDTKSKDFAVGFSSGDFCGSKAVGSNKESIGLCGDGKVHFNDNSNQYQQVDINEGKEIKFNTGLVFGVGYVFNTKQVIFTINGQEKKS